MSHNASSRFIVLFIFCCGILTITSCKKNNSTNDPGDNYTTDPSYKTPLSKGVNLSNWFNDYSNHAEFAERFTDKHFETLQQLGFTYVRIPIGETILFNEHNPSQLNAVNLQYVDAAVQRAVDHGLAVTLNYHPLTTNFEKTLPTNTANQDKLAEYWKAVANHFKKFSKTQVFFEVYNEPHVASDGSMFISKTWWEAVQLKFIRAIRQATPDHFVIVGGESWNGIDGLKLLSPYKQNNVVYNFHFYDPFVFTHQGASWAGDAMAKLKGVPYPSSPEAVQPILDTATDQEVIDMVTWYGQETWNKAKLAANVQRAVEWGATHNAGLICNEFGSYMLNAPRESRLNLIRDIREVLEENNIGWAMWEMDEGFGFINYVEGNRNNFTTDDEVLHSLGLK